MPDPIARHHRAEPSQIHDGPGNAGSVGPSGNSGLTRSPGSRNPHPQLDRLPARRAVMRWPNGNTSRGELAESPDGEMTFQALATTGPLAERRAKSGQTGLMLEGMPPRHLSVVPIPLSAGSAMPRVEPKLLTESIMAFRKDLLARLADVAAGAPHGIKREEEDMFSGVLMSALYELEGQCDDPAAARSAREALNRGRAFTYTFELDPRGTYHCSHRIDSGLLPAADASSDSESDAGSDSELDLDFDARLQLEPGSEAESDIEADLYPQEADLYPQEADQLSQEEHPLSRMLEALPEGEHIYLPVSQFASTTGHALGVSVTRLAGDEARISIVNSNGWRHCISLGLGVRDTPLTLSSSMSLSRADAMLKVLGEGSWRQPPDSLSIGRAWAYPSTGAPLFQWMLALSDNRAEPGQFTPTQKGEDCGLESYFTWLAAVLPKADYKLVKANTLSILAEAARHQGASEQTLSRLNERITSSLSGHAVTAQHPPLRC